MSDIIQKEIDRIAKEYAVPNKMDILNAELQLLVAKAEKEELIRNCNLSKKEL